MLIVAVTMTDITMDTMRSNVEATPPRVLLLATTMVAQYLSGFVSELGEEVARRLGAVEVQWVLLPWDKLFSPDHAPFDMAMQLITITITGPGGRFTDAISVLKRFSTS